MKRGVLILTLACTIGLLISSQSLASKQLQPLSSSQSESIQNSQQIASQQLNQKQTKEMQRLLNEQGYQVGNVDGTINQETMDGIRQFQESEGLAVTGTPNQETLRALAPGSDQQEFFGLSPEFGEMGKEAIDSPQTPKAKSY